MEPDDQSERLLALTLALVNSEIGFTKAELFEAIRGYRMDLGSIAAGKISQEALEKKFDLDKDRLRSLGIDIGSGSASELGDTEYRYRISRDLFVWPANSILSASEMQLIELAAKVWDRASLSPDAVNAKTRLRALASSDAMSETRLFVPKIDTFEPSFNPIRKAIDSHQVISFTYRDSRGQVSERLVEPWQLVFQDGYWFLLGMDRTRGEARNFLLRRIQSKIKPLKTELFPSPTSEVISNARSELASHLQSNVAKISVRPHTSAAMHFSVQTDGPEILSVHYYDLSLLVEELLEFGSDIKVVEPIELKNAIRTAILKVVEIHA